MFFLSENESSQEDGLERRSKGPICLSKGEKTILSNSICLGIDFLWHLVVPLIVLFTNTPSSANNINKILFSTWVIK